ncbi:LysR family transcriptional regulator [Marinovum sp. 2_MG-2023]|uniref:LysR family transcriptional regulator n=1 Tax=unclassified Marinovum TaxID=2647166 RepID=UPI0026E3E75C|nr:MULTISPECIES: LysR family transcriptional regulator [unclassified Marinovum]MDO6731859.1 LysR family transcriptional regulator [Marinovum sp. 2_MG-2023]MDO6781111.1 LysR family transcriptional regulator [Marinovum sp. 1_MG-2023]
MNFANSDLRSLAVFRAVVERGGFVGAQAELGMSQSTVSFHMKALETRLGFTLCERGRGGFRLTERGKLVHQKSTELFIALNDFEGEIGSLRDRVVGTLRLGIIDNTLSFDGLPLPRIINRLRRLAPEAEIQISVDDPQVLAADVSSGNIDVAIMPQTRPVAGVKMSKLYVERHSLYCAKGHALFDVPDREISESLVANQTFVARNYGNLIELDRFPNAHVGTLADHMEVQAMFILSGDYIGYLPDHFVMDRLDRGNLRCLLGEEAALNSQFVLATRIGRRSTGLMDLFVRELVGSLSEVYHRAT